MARYKILYVCHNHPIVRPGGAEVYALELHEAMRTSYEFDPIFLARIDPSAWEDFHATAPIRPLDGDPSQYLFGVSKIDPLYLTSSDKELYTRHFHEFLLAHKPDIVHFQHTLHLGFDLIRQVHNTLPDAPILYTLHEYLPICHRNGQMLRVNDELCDEPTPQRCHECFPYIQPQAFWLRKKLIESHFSMVDLFLAPCQFLLDRYVDWGIPREKIRFEDYGRRFGCSRESALPRHHRNRLGFFGQFNYFKGINVLLEAMQLLASSADEDSSKIHLWVHGANLELQPREFQKQMRERLEVTKNNVTMIGRYDRAQLGALMANIDWVVVPSIWWENSPLVIQEAFFHKKPVICSNIGGMAEKVHRGVDGLHFTAGDPRDLARTICQAVRSPELWNSLVSNIPDVYSMDAHVKVLGEIYHALLRSTPVGVS